MIKYAHIYHMVKFRFSKKATNFETTSHTPTWFDDYLVNVKSSGRLLQIFVAFSECSNFTEDATGLTIETQPELVIFVQKNCEVTILFTINIGGVQIYHVEPAQILSLT